MTIFFKTCYKCGETKPIDEFAKTRRKSWRCKDCVKESEEKMEQYKKEYREKNKEKIKKQIKNTGRKIKRK